MRESVVFQQLLPWPLQCRLFWKSAAGGVSVTEAFSLGDHQQPALFLISHCFPCSACTLSCYIIKCVSSAFVMKDIKNYLDIVMNDDWYWDHLKQHKESL